jgi:hypothetical protein
MGTSVRTVETHRLHLRRKLRIDGHAAFIKYAVDYADLLGAAPQEIRADWSISARAPRG